MEIEKGRESEMNLIQIKNSNNVELHSDKAMPKNSIEKLSKEYFSYEKFKAISFQTKSLCAFISHVLTIIDLLLPLSENEKFNKYVYLILLSILNYFIVYCLFLFLFLFVLTIKNIDSMK